MTPSDPDRRRLVFCNLLNGVPIPEIMTALKMSEKEVMDDFRYGAQKVRSYIFERGMMLVPMETIQEAQRSQAYLAHVASRVNFGKDPRFNKIEVLPYTADSVSDAEVMLRRHALERAK